MVKRIVKYNPGFLSDEELVENFVVRHSDLDTMVRILGENVTGSNQHILVVGPRGSGKTTLALRVAAEIRRKEEYKDRWYPLIFSEESYEVVTAGEFWLEALFHLSEQTGDDRWKVTYAELKKERDERRLAERALAQLLDFADSQGKRILLIVENINMLFGDLVSQEEAWKMRHTLINEPRLMLLATAANRFEQFENASHAMFEMFKLHELKRLDDEECNTIWELVAGKKLLGERIRPIRILTGGNPRLLTIIARFSAHRSFGKLLDDLVDLIDDHTEYFKSHLDNLPPIERKVYLSLADLWDPSTARDIAAAARLEVNPTSSLLKRLVGRGAVIAESQGKKAKYMVAERMYNIYYLMRRRGKPADRVQATVKFMSAMYDPEGTVRLIVEEASKLSPERCSDYYVAYSEVIKGIPDQDRREKIIHSTPKNFLESPYLKETLKHYLTIGKEIEEGPKEVQEILEEGYKHYKKGDCEQAIAKLDTIIERFGDTKEIKLLLLVAITLINKANILRELGRSEEELETYAEVDKRFGESQETAIAETVARALVKKGVTLGKLGRSEEELEAYEEVDKRFGEREETAITEKVVSALVNKGITLGELGRSEEELKAYKEVEKRFGEREETTIAEKVASALVNKGVTLGELGRSDDALKAYEEVDKRFGESKETSLTGNVARALINKGITLGDLNRSDDALKAYEEVDKRFGESQETTLIEPLVIALIGKGDTLVELRKFEQAEEAFLRAIQIDPEKTAAHVGLIDALAARLEKHAMALQKAEEIIDRRPDDSWLLCEVAWIFYERRLLPFLPQAEKWARRAVEISPKDLDAQHTLACILSAVGKGSEALEPAGRYVQDAALVERSIEDAIELFVELAASGFAKEALGLLRNSPSEKFLEPLVAGLRLFVGEDVTTAVEIWEVAKDVVQRIEDRRRS